MLMLDLSVDVKELMLYQQLYIYFIPIMTNIAFIMPFTVLVRLLWFRKHLKKTSLSYLNPLVLAPLRPV